MGDRWIKTWRNDSGLVGWISAWWMTETLYRLSRRTVAALLVAMLMAPLVAAASTQQQAVKGDGQTQSSTNASGQSKEANAAYSSSKTAATLPDDPEIARLQATDQNSGAQQTSPAQKTSKPVGTAAAPYEKTVGVAASRPAGAAIAPAKQRRVRALLIKVGVLVGAAVAVGTVVGLSKASSSRPR